MQWVVGPERVPVIRLAIATSIADLANLANAQDHESCR